MNLIDGWVKRVLKYEVRKSSDMWDLDEYEIDREHHIYTVEYWDEGGIHTTELWETAPNDAIKEGYRFLH